MNASLISPLNSRLVYPTACFSSLHEYWIGPTSNVPSNPTRIQKPASLTSPSQFTASSRSRWSLKPGSHPHPSQLRSHPNQARSLLSTPQYISASFSWTLVTTQICPSFLTSSPASSLLANLLHSQIVNQTISLPASQKGKSFPMFLKNKSQTNSSG